MDDDIMLYTINNICIPNNFLPKICLSFNAWIFNLSNLNGFYDVFYE